MSTNRLPEIAQSDLQAARAFLTGGTAATDAPRPRAERAIEVPRNKSGSIVAVSHGIARARTRGRSLVNSRS